MIFLFLGYLGTKTFYLDCLYAKVKFTIWDTAIRPRLPRVRELPKVHSAIIVYDTTRQDSLRIARKCLGEFSPDIFKALAGSRADLVSKREVTYEVICFSIGLRQA